MRRQAGGFGLVKIHHQRNRSLWQVGRMEQANAARVDQADERRRATGDDLLASTPRPSKATVVACKRSGAVMAQAQTGRPTMKRAPKGSDVASAWVGRMFSAQITPPCASTICLEIDSPRPELLPNCPCGRSE